MKLNILTLALILTASSFSFADHNHISSNCQLVQYQDFVEGHWEKQFVPATYRTVRVFDSCSRTYIQKQILVTPACYKNVWIEGRYVTKTRYVCTPVVQAPVCEITPPVCETTTSIHFGERAPSDNFRTFSGRESFRQPVQQSVQWNSPFYKQNDFRKGQGSFRFKKQDKKRDFSLKIKF